MLPRLSRLSVYARNCWRAEDNFRESTSRIDVECHTVCPFKNPSLSLAQSERVYSFSLSDRRLDHSRQVWTVRGKNKSRLLARDYAGSRSDCLARGPKSKIYISGDSAPPVTAGGAWDTRERTTRTTRERRRKRKRESATGGGRRERDVRRFRRVHIVRGIRLAGEPDVCAPPVTYRSVLRLLLLRFSPSLGRLSGE